ncbi:MAG: type II secretion system protein [Patescibacteria group bacterium]|mgnify:CR=1 FL=1
MNYQRAFSLIELLVSIGIIAMISAVVFFNFPQFNESVALNRAARELTLTLREAQSRAIAVTPLPNGEFPNNYGVFIKGTPTAEGDGQFLIFSDGDNNDLKYDTAADPSDVLIKTVTFTRGVQITGFNLDGATPTGGVNFIYYRPGPQVIVSDETGACVSGVEGSGNGQNPLCAAALSPYASTLGSYGPFNIAISRPASSPPGGSRTVEIWRTGQISIK